MEFLEKYILLTDQSRICMDMIFEPTLPYKNFTPYHWVPILLVALFGIIIIKWASKKSIDTQYKILFYLSLIPFSSVVGRMVLTYIEGTFTLKDELPLQLCRTLAILLPFLIAKRQVFWLKVSYFLIIVGTLQALVTADLDYLPPHYSYFLYWITHCFLVILPLYWVFVLGIAPSLTHLKYAFYAANVYLVVTLVINSLLGSNYFYSSHKPAGGSMLDFFGPWPIYLFVVEAVAVILFYLAFLPFAGKPVKDRLQKVNV